MHDNHKVVLNHMSDLITTNLCCCLRHPKFIIFLGWLVRGQGTVVVVQGEVGEKGREVDEISVGV